MLTLMSPPECSYGLKNIDLFYKMTFFLMQILKEPITVTIPFLLITFSILNSYWFVFCNSFSKTFQQFLHF